MQPLAHQLHHLLQHDDLVTGVAHKEATGDTAGAALLSQISPVAWQHINLYGRYEFTMGPDPIDVDAMVETLTQTPLVPVEEDE